MICIYNIHTVKIQKITSLINIVGEFENKVTLKLVNNQSKQNSQTNNITDIISFVQIPVNKLECKANTDNALNCPNSDGIVP